MTTNLDEFLPSWGNKPEQPQEKEPKKKNPAPGIKKSSPSLEPKKLAAEEVKVHYPEIPEEIRAMTFKIHDSPFGFNNRDYPLGQGLAIGMARGVIKKFHKGKATIFKGVIKIDDTDHPFEDPGIFARIAGGKEQLETLVDKEVSFTFHSNYSVKFAPMLKINSPVLLKIFGHRTNLPAPNAVEVMGLVVSICEAFFTVTFSARYGKRFLVNVHGKYPGQIGEIIFVRAALEKGLIRYRQHELLYTLPAGTGEPDHQNFKDSSLSASELP